MIKKLLRSKVLAVVLLVSILIIAAISYFIPKIAEENTIQLVTKNSINSVKQMKLTRAYYVNSVVKDVKKYAPNLKFDYFHAGVNGKLPFPTTTIHDLSKIFSENTGVQFDLYSNYPFKPKINRVLSLKQKEILRFTKKNKDGIYIQRDNIDGIPVLRVAVADFMTDISCVKCHNSHPDRTWANDKWKLGDQRGVIEVITPLEESLLANEDMKNHILIVVISALLFLVIYYSYILVSRESELLDKNITLDEKVQEEILKNEEKAKQLVLQNRSATLGDMLAAIIHQWKQPLNAISILNSSILVNNEIKTLDDEKIKELTGQISSQISLMNTTMHDFGNFFKPKNKECYDINNEINEVIRIIDGIYKSQNITLKLNLENGLTTSGYSNELKQVIINILNNSRDAILENNSDIKTIFIDTYKDKNNLNIISIKDCAGGIPNHLISKVFDAYVTTKENTGGTGIGLDMCKTIIHKVNGSIIAKNVETIIDNKTFKGASFIIILGNC